MTAYILTAFSDLIMDVTDFGILTALLLFSSGLAVFNMLKKYA